ncbi:hypothetical protein OBBRIDRAFT_46896 [Obba rivulosa]|uniref:Uncharacterized protein n=1 Tax=Obba rivulosa TaxID=1052685 RepID=A0A8E2DJ58_9APHY|nr:hypothetical protein OBBRIDRAFT_46896 [Obba rivulosa]
MAKEIFSTQITNISRSNDRTKAAIAASQQPAPYSRASGVPQPRHLQVSDMPCSDSGSLQPCTPPVSERPRGGSVGSAPRSGATNVKVATAAPQQFAPHCRASGFPQPRSNLQMSDRLRGDTGPQPCTLPVSGRPRGGAVAAVPASGASNPQLAAAAPQQLALHIRASGTPHPCSLPAPVGPHGDSATPDPAPRVVCLSATNPATAAMDRVQVLATGPGVTSTLDSHCSVSANPPCPNCAADLYRKWHRLVDEDDYPGFPSRNAVVGTVDLGQQFKDAVRVDV